MVDLFVATFAALLLLYMAYSQWARLDPRWPIGGGLVLLAFAGLADAGGAHDLANTIAVYTFLLLGAGIVLLLADYVREQRTLRRRSAEGGEPADER